MAVLKEIVRKGLPPQTHAYDDPSLDALSFLRAVYHDSLSLLDAR